MKFAPLAVAGAWSIRPEPQGDHRGWFARTWCRLEFASHDIDFDAVQASVSHNLIAGTVRGMHFSRPPAREAKLVSCGRGRILDVLLDLRPESPTFLVHTSIEIDDADHQAVYVPPGVAHGFQTLVDDAEVRYMMSEAYQPSLADGVRFDDPAFGIRWPLPVACIADRDRRYVDFNATLHARRMQAEAGA